MRGVETLFHLIFDAERIESLAAGGIVIFRVALGVDGGEHSGAGIYLYTLAAHDEEMVDMA